jgi:hypothetical protein
VHAVCLHVMREISLPVSHRILGESHTTFLNRTGLSPTMAGHSADTSNRPFWSPLLPGLGYCTSSSKGNRARMRGFEGGTWLAPLGGSTQYPRRRSPLLARFQEHTFRGGERMRAASCMTAYRGDHCKDCNNERASVIHNVPPRGKWSEWPGCNRHQGRNPIYRFYLKLHSRIQL